MEDKYKLENSKIIWLDVETTGFDNYKNDIITMCFLLEHNNQIIDSAQIFVQPFNYSNISKEALSVHGITTVQMSEFKDPVKAFREDLLPFLQRNYNGNQYIMAGQNIKFDRNHLHGYWAKCRAKENSFNYYGPTMLFQFSSVDIWFNENMIDTMSMAKFCQKHGLTNFIDKNNGKKSVKLEIMCKEMNIKYESHDAINDIIATKIVANRLWSIINRSNHKIIEFQKEYPFMYNMFNKKLICEI